MIRIAALLLLSYTAALAQIQILLVDSPGSERPVSGLHDIGSVPVGDRLDTVFRVRNTAQSSLTIRTLVVAGAGFSVFGQPSFPHVLAPGLNMDFTVRFSPRDYGSYSANLSVNGAGVLLAGSAAAGPVLVVDGARIPSGSTLDLGLAERGTDLSKSFRLENPTKERLVVQTIAVTGAQFRSGSQMDLPFTLMPGSAIDFQVTFAPAGSGVYQGALVIDGRSYKLTGAEHEPPFPKPTILIDLPNPTSGQQGRVSVEFGEASRAMGTGTLKMEFRSAVPSAPDDEAVRFLKDNRRSSFAINQGTTTPVSGMTFQTGTTAGTIVFTAEVGAWTVSSSVHIEAGRVHIDKVRASRKGSMLEIEITGYDNTRSLSELAFTFFLPQRETIRVDATSDFRRFYDNTTLGGAFTVKAVFPVSGPIANISSTEIEAVNASGRAGSGRIDIQ